MLRVMPYMRVADMCDSEEELLGKSNKKHQKRYNSEETDSYTNGTGAQSNNNEASGDGTTSAISENTDGDFVPTPEWQAIIARQGGRGRKEAQKGFKDQGVINTILSEEVGVQRTIAPIGIKTERAIEGGSATSILVLTDIGLNNTTKVTSKTVKTRGWQSWGVGSGAACGATQQGWSGLPG
ncbi:hypothetical protein CVT24_006523 [Panaeolus cyanescens]|uniref:Uncharacterized protein n=1 Tax=Panaeolus cyanescens TaxID=181874 RepID=A0A409WNF4_9AGAR|nr:hypothetical protein CVT24_006523 [Panaeolus cyanescens]